MCITIPLSALGQNQLLLTKQTFVQELVDVFNNHAKYYDRGRITVKITGALLYVFQHIVGSSKLHHSHFTNKSCPR